MGDLYLVYSDVGRMLGSGSGGYADGKKAQMYAIHYSQHNPFVIVSIFVMSDGFTTPILYRQYRSGRIYKKLKAKAAKAKGAMS